MCYHEGGLLIALLVRVRGKFLLPRHNFPRTRNSKPASRLLGKPHKINQLTKKNIQFCWITNRRKLFEIRSVDRV